MCPPTNASNDINYIWMASDKDVIWNLRLLLCSTQGHYNGAIVQAQERGFTFSQPVCTFPSQRGISWEVWGTLLITSPAQPHSRGRGSHTWAGRGRLEPWTPRPVPSQQHKSSGPAPSSLVQFSYSATSALPSPEMAERLSKSHPHPTPSSQSSAISSSDCTSLFLEFSNQCGMCLSD